MFKKCLFVLLALFVVVVVGIPDQQVQAEPAVVIDDISCGGFVPNPDTEDGFPPLAFLSTTESHGVLTKSGVNILTCHFDHLVDLPYATGARGFLCGTVFGITDDSKMIATPGGKATLVCKINGEDKL